MTQAPHNRDLASTLGKRARAARLALGLTQAQAAEAIGITVEFYARMERGQVLPSVTTLLRISQALETPTDQLLGLTRPDYLN